MSYLPRSKASTFSKGAICVLAFMALSACSFLEVDNSKNVPYSKIYSNVDMHSAYPTIDRKSFEYINLVELIDPSEGAKKEYPQAWGVANAGEQWGVKYDLVLNWFRLSAKDSKTNIGMTDEVKRQTRNGVQEKLLSASISRCNVFKTYLQRKQSDFNFGLGLGSTVAGVLGAVLPGVNASRNLAGTAGLFSGAQAQFNQAYFSNLAANTVVRGIESRQAQVQTQIRTIGQRRGVADYSMEAAIGDAIYFDGLCSVHVGLQEAENSIRLVANPGLAEAARTILTVRAMGAIASGDMATLTAGDQLKKYQALISSNSSPLAAVAHVDPAAGADSLDIVSTLGRLKAETDAAISTTIQSIASDYSSTTAAWLPSMPSGSPSLPDIGTITSTLRATLKGGIQDSIAQDLTSCTAAVSKLASDLVSAKVELSAAISPGDLIAKKLKLDTAYKAAETQALKFKAVSDLVAIDLANAEKASKHTWQNVTGTGAVGYDSLFGKLKAVKTGWPEIKFLTAAGGDATLCK